MVDHKATAFYAAVSVGFVLFFCFFFVPLCDCEWVDGWLELTQHGCSAALMRGKEEGRRRFVVCHQSEQLMIPDWKIQLFSEAACVKVASIGGHVTEPVLLFHDNMHKTAL